MKLGVTKLSSAVRLALSLGAVIAVGASGTVFAQDAGAQDAANQPSQKKASTLETVVVTGSRVRRVDLHRDTFAHFSHSFARVISRLPEPP